MKDAWGEAEALVAFRKRNDAHFWNDRNLGRKVLWTIVLGLNPIVGTFYVLQTVFVYREFLGFIRLQQGQQRQGQQGQQPQGQQGQQQQPQGQQGQQQQPQDLLLRRKEIAKAMADSWVAVGVADPRSIPKEYKLKEGAVVPDPKLVLNLAGTVDDLERRRWPTETAPVLPPPPILPPLPPNAPPPPHDDQPRAPPPVHFFLLNYEGMLALLLDGVLDHTYYKQLKFLGRRKGLEVFIIGFQSMSYIIAVVSRRILHLKVAPIEAIGFTCSLLFLVYLCLQLSFASRSKKGLLIYLTPDQEGTIRASGPNRQPQEGTIRASSPNQQPQWQPQWPLGTDPDLYAFIWTFVVGFVLAVVATVLVLPVLATKNKVDMLGHIIFFGDFLFQFIFLIIYFTEGFGTRIDPNVLLAPLLLTGIISSAGVGWAIYATIRHWHDQGFDKATPSLGRYVPFIR